MSTQPQWLVRLKCTVHPLKGDEEFIEERTVEAATAEDAIAIATDRSKSRVVGAMVQAVATKKVPAKKPAPKKTAAKKKAAPKKATPKKKATGKKKGAASK